jgi:hypothetical protein
MRWKYQGFFWGGGVSSSAAVDFRHNDIPRWAVRGGGESVVQMKPGNVGGGKGPQLKTDARSDEGHVIDDWSSYPKVYVQQLQTASHGTSCVFSESRMREICLSGSMSGNRKQDQAKPD